MKYSFLSLGILACCALSGHQNTDVDLTFNLGSKTNAPAKKVTECNSFEQGIDMLSDTTPAAYSHPANMVMEGQWGGFVTLSYLYWLPGQEGMDIARTTTYTIANVGTDDALMVSDSTRQKNVFQKFEYTSGYKIGAGYNFNRFDNWVVRADYTSLHQKVSQDKSAPATDLPDRFGTYYTTGWFFQTTEVRQQHVTAPRLTSAWHLDLDLVDATASRPYYQGKKLTVTPFGGLRSAFIRQSFRITAYSVSNSTPPVDPIKSHNHSHSWGIGPRAGFETRWILGRGFRFQGDVGGSLLFTQYTRVSHREDSADAERFDYPIKYSMHNYNCLRPVAEMGLGLGWSHTFNSVKTKPFVLDFSATYDFNYFWGQNMMRTLNDININNSNAASNNLYLHGLTITGTCNF